MSWLSIDDIHVRRGHSSVLRGVSIDVEQGEVVTLLGSNGMGKSTTLRTLSGLHRPHRGKIMFDGTRIDRRPMHEIVRDGVAHVPEGRQVFPAMTVRENLEMGAFVRRSASEGIEEAVRRFPVLETFLDSPAGSLSGGQQQMLAVARGLMSKPRLLLLDEPTLGLAPLVVAEIGAIIRSLREEGVTVLLVEQNTALALDVSDRAYVLVEGRVELSGPSAELLASGEIRKAYMGI
ncbi:ABC transporter ATP-binding protein [Pseudonocardia sp.]|uniref:ABC transporter ATP-binding protein n=1 Tax=Pseudonocardia sp. TaxID=60912 RepID=UPI003D12A300